MKRIKGVKKYKHKLVMKAVIDYFGSDPYANNIKRIAESVMGVKNKLTEEELSAVWAIKTNLEDTVYLKHLSEASL